MAMSNESPLLTQANQLYANYYAQIRNYNPDFADDLLREALRCYSTESYTAVCILCRAAVEESINEIYELHVNLGHPSTRLPVERMELEALKQWAHRLHLIDQVHFDVIGEIQHRGNRSAHGPTADMAHQLRLRAQNDLAQPLEIWADQSDALNQVNSTSRTLHELKLRKANIQTQGAFRV
jgi:hypothetical protein